jgi:hypothetical protein
MNAARSRAAKARAYAAPAPASQSGQLRNLLHPVLAVATPGIEAVLQLALVIKAMESPVAEGRKNDDGNDGGDIAAPARMRLRAGVVRRGLTHAERLEARCSTSPSAAIALATIPLASSPAAAYMRSGLS